MLLTTIILLSSFKKKSFTFRLFSWFRYFFASDFKKTVRDHEYSNW